MKSELLFWWQWNNTIPDMRKCSLARGQFWSISIYTYLSPKVFILKGECVKHTNTYFSCFIIHILFICTNEDNEICVIMCLYQIYSQILPVDYQTLPNESFRTTQTQENLANMSREEKNRQSASSPQLSQREKPLLKVYHNMNSRFCSFELSFCFSINKNQIKTELPPIQK